MMSSAQALKAAVTQAPAPRAPRGIVALLDDPKVKSGLTAVAGKLLEPTRLLQLCVSAVKRTPALLDCDPASVLGALMTSAALGLEPNTVQQQAYLIPYKRRAKVGNQWVDVVECQFQLGYRGFVTLLYRSPRVKSLDAGVIREGDHFRNRIGTGPDAGFAYEMALRGRGEILGAFSFVTMQDGSSAFVVPADEIWKVRSKSETYRFLAQRVAEADGAERAKAEKKLAETPWVQWEDSMAMKTAIKAHAKILPIYAGDMVAAAAAIDDAADGRQALDLRRMTDPDAVRAFVGGVRDDLPVVERVDDEDDGEISGEAYGTRDREPPAEPPPPAAEPAPQASPAPAPQAEKPAARSAKPVEKAPTYAQLAERIKASKDADAAAVVLDQSRHLPADQQADLAALYRSTFQQE